MLTFAHHLKQTDDKTKIGNRWRKAILRAGYNKDTHCFPCMLQIHKSRQAHDVSQKNNYKYIITD